MDKTTLSLLTEVCELKDIDLTKDLKNDVDTVLKTISEDVYLSGIKAKLENIYKEIRNAELSASRVQRYQSAVMDCKSKLDTACEKAKSYIQVASELSKRSDSKFIVGDEKAMNARNLAAGMLSDAVQIIGVDKLDGTAIAAIYNMASYVAWGMNPNRKDSWGSVV